MAIDWRRISKQEKDSVVDSLRKRAAERDGNVEQGAGAAVPGRARPLRPKESLVVFEPDELPDYFPPVRFGQVKSDPEGRVWILPTTSVLAGRGLVYDLVDRDGRVTERVRLPDGRNLIAIGDSGAVYMSYTPGGETVRLECSHVIR